MKCLTIVIMVRKLNIYFIHTKALKERQSVIDNFQAVTKKFRFKDLALTYKTIDVHDPADITMETVKQYVDYARIPEGHVEFYNQLLKNLHVNQLSNTLKHFKALELIADNSNDGELNLILEDDILYEERVCMSLEKAIASLPQKFDIVFLGMPTITSAAVDKSKYKYEDTHNIFKVLPVCDSYLVSHSAAKALVANYTPVKFVNNTQLSYVCDKLGMSTLQAIPNIFIDGSKYGLFLSKLSTNNPLIFNNDFTALRNLVNKQTLTKEDVHEVEKLISRSAIKMNPDFIHMECLYHMKQENYTKATERFKQAYETYMGNGCVLSNDSVFLRDYIRIHKHLQPSV